MSIHKTIHEPDLNILSAKDTIRLVRTGGIAMIIREIERIIIAKFVVRVGPLNIPLSNHLVANHQIEGRHIPIEGEISFQHALALIRLRHDLNIEQLQALG